MSVLQRASRLAVNPASFLRQMPFPEKHVPVFTLLSPPVWGGTGPYGVLHGVLSLREKTQVTREAEPFLLRMRLDLRLPPPSR